MPFPMKIQPINDDFPANRVESNKPVLKSRLKRLLDRPFTNVLKNSIITVTSEAQHGGGGGVTDFEPSSVVLAKMVQNYMEENNNEKQSTKSVRNHRCNCFNGNNDSSSDDESDGGGDYFNDAYEHFKSLIPCESNIEENLLADTTKILEKKNKSKLDLKKIVVNGLLSLGYDSSICKSKWDKSRSIPAGEYEYIDVIVKGERFIIDVDFRSEFEIARQTNSYKALIQSLPFIFVGKSDRILKIVSLVSEAAKQSLKKKGMHFPPWRKGDYMRAKWLSSLYTRISGENSGEPPVVSAVVVAEKELDCSEIELVFEERDLSPPVKSLFVTGDDDVAVEKTVTGLASLFKENH